MALYFQKIVDAVLDGVINPIIAAIFGKANFADIGFDIGDAGISIGLVIDAVISFVVVAFFLFLVIKAYNNFKAKATVEEPEAPAEPSPEIVLLTEIRDELRPSAARAEPCLGLAPVRRATCRGWPTLQCRDAPAIAPLRRRRRSSSSRPARTSDAARRRRRRRPSATSGRSRAPLLGATTTTSSRPATTRPADDDQLGASHDGPSGHRRRAAPGVNDGRVSDRPSGRRATASS